MSEGVEIGEATGSPVSKTAVVEVIPFGATFGPDITVAFSVVTTATSPKSPPSTAPDVAHSDAGGGV